jgi:hypothetical protein
MSNTTNPPLEAVHQSLYPTFGSLEEAFEYACSRLPVTTPNEMCGVLMTYHNTLLKTVEQR